MAESEEMQASARHSRFMRFARALNEVNTIVAILVSAALMAALTAIVLALNIPNPNIILMAGLVVCSTLLGFRGGVVAAVIMIGYTLFFFSTGNDFVTFTDQNMQKVVVSIIGVFIVTAFVSGLHGAVSEALLELGVLTVKLEEDNALLEQRSMFDQLTETRNRFALRRDFPTYLNTDLCVMMVDVDDFKETNDQYGHNTGDYVLNRIGACLVKEFSNMYVYRYGGDEFLVMYPCDDSAEFAFMVDSMMGHVGDIRLDDAEIPVHISCGYVYGVAVLQSDLRLMIRQADVNLYDAKAEGKDRYKGAKFSHVVAENASITGHGVKERVTDPLHHD